MKTTGIHQYTMNQYQADAAKTMIYKWKVIYPALGLANEAGEVLGKIKKLIRDMDITFDGIDTIPAQKKAEICDELGDVLWYIAALSKDLGITMNEVAAMNHEKLQSRKIRGVIKGSGDKR